MKTVLVIDDDATLRDTIGLMLETEGFSPAFAENGEVGLAQALTLKPSLVLVDLRMPGLSGMELLKRLADAASNTAVIMITGYGDVPTAVSAMKLGAFHFVQKPFDAEALLNIVEETLARADEVRDLQADIRASQGRGHAKDAGAHYFPPCADGTQSWAFQRRQ